MKIRMALFAASVAVAGIGVPAEAAAKKKKPKPLPTACYVVVDPPADTKWFLVNMDAAGFDITSADIKIDPTWTTVVMRFSNLRGQDAWTLGWGKYVTFLWRPQGQRPGTYWYGVQARVPLVENETANIGPVFKYGASSQRGESVYPHGDATGVVDYNKNEIRIWVKNADLRRIPQQVGSLSAGVRQGEFKVTAQTLSPTGSSSTGNLLDETSNDVTKGIYTSGQKSCIASAR